jgi:hypothetical protein
VEVKTDSLQQSPEMVLAAPQTLLARLPLPIVGIDSDNGSESINYHLLTWSVQHKITFTWVTVRVKLCSPSSDPPS